jgi:hypothetical protein
MLNTFAGPYMQVSCLPIEQDRLGANPISWIRYCEGDIYQIERRLRTMRQRVSTIEAFLLAMTLNPDVHKKAQKEIDEQIGDRLIEVSDRENLPYITCLLKEVMRYVHPLIDNPRTDSLFGQMELPRTIG